MKNQAAVESVIAAAIITARANNLDKSFDLAIAVIAGLEQSGYKIIRRADGRMIHCAQCGEGGHIPQRDCANKHFICSKCWTAHDTGCPACDGLVREAMMDDGDPI